MKIGISLDVFSFDEYAVGCVSGTIELPVVPRVGECISFIFNDNNISPINISGFRGLCKVESVLHSLSGQGDPIALSRESAHLKTLSDAKAVMKYLCDGFDLKADFYDI